MEDVGTRWRETSHELSFRFVGLLWSSGRHTALLTWITQMSLGLSFCSIPAFSCSQQHFALILRELGGTQLHRPFLTSLIRYRLNIGRKKGYASNMSFLSGPLDPPTCPSESESCLRVVTVLCTATPGSHLIPQV